MENLSWTFADDESTTTPEEPAYEFAGYEIIASEKVALTPPGTRR